MAWLWSTNPNSYCSRNQYTLLGSKFEHEGFKSPKTQTLGRFLRNQGGISWLLHLNELGFYKSNAFLERFSEWFYGGRIVRNCITLQLRAKNRVPSRGYADPPHRRQERWSTSRLGSMIGRVCPLRSWNIFCRFSIPTTF